MGTSQFEYEMTVADLGSNAFGFVDGTGGAIKRIAKQGQALPLEIVVGSDGTTRFKSSAVSEGNHDMVITFEGYNVSTTPTLGSNDSYGDPVRMRWDETQELFTTIEYPGGHPRDDLRTFIEALVGKVIRIAITKYDIDA